MIAYAGINNFITPVLALANSFLVYVLVKAKVPNFIPAIEMTPWRGFCKGAIITLLMALTVSFLTRKKIFWRT
jgi:cellulose synthase/poly-beta-1,6-N-acetylglucosamine synthase-like glycosyltransferase